MPKPGPKETTKLQSKEVKVPITLTRRESKDVPIQVHIESKKTTEPAIPKVDLKPVNREAPKEPMKMNIRSENEPIDKVKLSYLFWFLTHFHNSQTQNCASNIRNNKFEYWPSDIKKLSFKIYPRRE